VRGPRRAQHRMAKGISMRYGALGEDPFGSCQMQPRVPVAGGKPDSANRDTATNATTRISAPPKSPRFQIGQQTAAQRDTPRTMRKQPIRQR
jgi:hypothetical protein